MSKEYMDYFLGRLPEPACEALEERMFAEDDCFSQLEAAENDLVDAYVLGTLSAEDRQRVEKHYLKSGNPAARRRKLEIARLVRASVDERQPAPWWQLLFAPFQTPRLAFAAVALALVVLGWYGMNWMQPGKVQQPEVAVAPPVKPTPEPPQLIAKAVPPPPMPSLELNPVLQRSAGTTTTKLKMPAGATAARLKLRLETNAWSTYGLTIETPEGTVLWKADRLRATGAGTLVEATVPASILTRGDYLVRLNGQREASQPESAGDYAFQVR